MVDWIMPTQEFLAVRRAQGFRYVMFSRTSTGIPGWLVGETEEDLRRGADERGHTEVLVLEIPAPTLRTFVVLYNPQANDYFFYGTLDASILVPAAVLKAPYKEEVYERTQNAWDHWFERDDMTQLNDQKRSSMIGDVVVDITPGESGMWVIGKGAGYDPIRNEDMRDKINRHLEGVMETIG